MSAHDQSGERSKRTTSNDDSNRKFEWAKLIVPGIFAILAALVTGALACIAAVIVIVFPIVSSGERLSDNDLVDGSYIDPIPTAGAQLDFSPRLPTDISPTQIPDLYSLKPSPFGGVYLSELGLRPEDTSPSWKVHYEDGSVVPAQSETCLINRGAAEHLQAPLNRRMNRVILLVTIFTDHRYSLTITDVELILTSYLPTDRDIDHIEVMDIGGAGGGGSIFTTVRTPRLELGPNTVGSQQIEFRDFELRPGDGVEMYMPILLTSGGTYQFQVKVNTNATPVYDDPGGELSLTSGRASWSWAQIDDPRAYEVLPPADAVDELFVDLILCP